MGYLLRNPDGEKSGETLGKASYEFDTTTGSFSDPGNSGTPVAGVAGPTRERLQDISDALKERSRTKARAAIFNALLREAGQGAGAGIRGRDGLLARLVHVQNQFSVRTRGIF